MEGTQKDKQRAEIFDALGHPMRLRILKVLSEGPLGFAELKRSLNVESSGHIQFHLDKLNGLIKTEDGKYCISDKGKDALLTMQPIEKYNEDARFREQVGLLIRALRSEEPSIQEIAVVQLSLFGSKAVPNLKSALLEAFAELNSEGKWGHIDAPERAINCLVMALGIISVPNSVSDIAQALPRVAAFKALAKIGNKQALDAIVPAIPAWYTKGEYEEHYWQRKDTDEVELDTFLRETFNGFEEEGRIALETALTTENFEGKKVIARALAVVGDDKSIPALTLALENGDFPTKTEAAKTLVKLKAIEVMPKIINQLLKAEDSLKTARIERGYGSSEDESAQKMCEVLAETVLSMGSVDNWITIAFHRPRINYHAESFDEAIVKSKEKAMPALTVLLQDPDASVQIAAAEMIAKIKRGDNEDHSSYTRY